MKYLPFENITDKTKLTPKEVLKRINKIILPISLLFLFFSCNKEKPTKGSYVGDFFGTYQLDNGSIQEKNLLGVQFEITEVTKDYIIISGAKLEKNKKRIKGTLNKHFDFGDFIKIDGRLKKEKGHYIIEGDFTSTDLFMQYNPYLVRDITGKFKIKPDN